MRKQMQDYVIKIEGIKKRYQLGLIGGKTLKEDIRNWCYNKIHKKKQIKKEYFWALDGINIDIKRGEAIGIIGTNGAGKSTLLKILSRVTTPTDGQVFIKGKITSMLEVGTGFHGELTGRQNIYLNGAILGMSKDEVDSKIDDIIEFSECKEFIDTPVKRYSSGMYVKLAFAVAAHLDSDIIIMDEVLAVGDAAFQKKCLDKMYKMVKEDNKTILYVSHNMSTVRELCSRVVVLEKGKIRYCGDVEEGIKQYLGVGEELDVKTDFSNMKRKATDITGDAIIETIKMLNNSTGIIELGDNIEFYVSFLCKKKLDNPCFRFVIHTLDGRNVATTMSSRIFGCVENGKKVLTGTVATSFLAPGRYAINFILFSPNGYGGFVQYDVVDNAIQFQVISSRGKYYSLEWINNAWGNIALPEVYLEEKDEIIC